MDKEQVNTAFKKAEGALRQAAGKIENTAMRETGKVQNAMGGMKDAIRDQKEKRSGSY